jgi:hypothetical protein
MELMMRDLVGAAKAGDVETVKQHLATKADIEGKDVRI